MKRREFIQIGTLSALASTLLSPSLYAANKSVSKKQISGRAKNIIFLVSDGMSVGTLTMADLLLQRKEGRSSTWMQLYRENKTRHSLMDTSSASSLVTDSAAASSAWGGGAKVNNGALNVGPDGTNYKPILQKFKEAGKSVGCVTTVPITHATPAGFCINAASRGNQEEIASLYLPLCFDVMMGGGLEFFSPAKRKDGSDLFSEYTAKGYRVVQSKDEMNNAGSGKPLLGIFYENGLPYTLDQQSDNSLMEKIPSLASMTRKAITLMENNPEGFVLQVEGGKVDWAAHANDIGAMLYDQLAFDEALAVAIDFAEKRDDTLVIITTDHGNSNPGLLYGTDVNLKFDIVQQFKHTNEWILNGIRYDHSPARVIERMNYAQNITLSEEEARSILADYSTLQDMGEGLYNPYKLPYRKLAEIQQKHTSVVWADMNHTSDFVELAMYGPGSEALKPFVNNTELHSFMLEAAGLPVEVYQLIEENPDRGHYSIEDLAQHAS